MYIMIIPEESTDINDLLVPDSARFYPENSGFDIRKAIFINPTEEEAYKYLDIIEEHPDWIEYYIISFNEYRGLVPDGQRVDIKGDLDGNRTIDTTDLTLLSLTLIGDKTLSDVQMITADIDDDGNVTLADLARLQQYLSKKIDSL